MIRNYILHVNQNIRAADFECRTEQMSKFWDRNVAQANIQIEKLNSSLR